MAWDNPFGVFPGTKKDLEKKKKEADGPIDRPATSSSSKIQPSFRNAQERPSFDDRRPQTSHGQRSTLDTQQKVPFDEPFGLSDGTAQHRPPPGLRQQYDDRAQTSFQRPRDQMPMRPAPTRSATGPAPPGMQNNLAQEYMPQHHRGQSLQHQNHRDPNSYPPQRDYHDMSRQPNGTSNSNFYAAELPTPDVLPRDGLAKGSYDLVELPASNALSHLQNHELGYTNADSMSPDRNGRQSIAPNFAAIRPGATESVEKQITLQTDLSDGPFPAQPYRKAKYGDQGPRSLPMRPGLTNVQSPTSPTAKQPHSPMDGFDFGLNSAEQMAPVDQQYPNKERAYTDQEHANYRQPASTSRSNNTASQFPPRDESRSQARGQTQTGGFVHSYNRPSAARPAISAATPSAPRGPGVRSPMRQLPPARAEYGFDQYGYPDGQTIGNAASSAYQHDTYQDRDVPTMHQSYSEPSLAYDSGQYHPRVGQQPQVNAPTRPRPHPQTNEHIERAQTIQSMSTPHTDYRDIQVPPRPRTANSARSHARQHVEQAIPSAQTSNSALPIADRNHPPPIRPGLIDSQPATNSSRAPYAQVTTSQTVQPISPPRREPPKASIKGPVTIQELNDLRLAYKVRPTDDNLGLKFAKRLVEAANVLASEGGKADAKTTARNRERYINDAYRIVKKLVGNGSPDAMFYLADCYGQGQLGLEVNPREAFQLYNSAAKVGHPQSAYRVAVCCELGQDAGGGTRRDHLKAVQFYRKAATLGDGPAMFKVGMILLKGLLGQQPNRREGISWLKRAADKADEDNPHALHELAMLYENASSTDVIIKDEGYALQLYTQAANLGYKYSQHRLGTAYEYGTLGVQIDPRMSIAWYSKAAAQGEHQSEFALSGWYLTGSEPLLAQSDTEAYLWARKAAQNGLPKAEYAMGYYSEVGIGCRPDIEEAKKWYFRAAGKY